MSGNFFGLIEMPMLLARPVQRHRDEGPFFRKSALKPWVIEGLGGEHGEFAREVDGFSIFEYMHQVPCGIAAEQHRPRKGKRVIEIGAIRAQKRGADVALKHLAAFLAKGSFYTRQLAAALFAQVAATDLRCLAKLTRWRIDHVEQSSGNALPAGGKIRAVHVGWLR